MNKKETKKETSSEKPTSNVRSYYTKEILQQINEMGVKEMESIMKDLANTPFWIAILKYTGMRTPLLDVTLRSADPSKEQHKISWSQGCMAGLCDIEGYVIDLNTPKSQVSEEPTDNGGEIPPTSKPEGVIIS